ncbi:ATP-binding cassette domain-containing protein [Candidatus Dojkabacteria bacterium]|nr:ATP-binding cassette domain-containing protein [Candidatus Dojkabacteria bacterium]
MGRIFRLSLKYIKRYKWSFFVGVSLIILGRAGANVSQLMTKYIFDELDAGDFDAMLFFIMLFAGLRFIPTILGPLGNQVHDRYLINGAKDMKIDVFRKLHELDVFYHSTKRSGSLISRMRRGENAFWSWNIELERNLLRILVDLVFTAVAFFFVNPVFMLIIVTGFIANLAFTYILIRLNMRRRRRLNKQEDRITGIIADNMINYDTVKYFANEGKEQQRLGTQYSKWRDAIWAYANSFRIIELWIGILITLSVTSLFLVSRNDLINGEMSVGDFALIITFSLSFFPRLGEVVFRFRELSIKQTDFEKYLEILDEEIGVVEAEDAEKLDIENVKGRIEYKNVEFEYQEREKVVKDFNLEIKPHESMAFVGVSGAGKSTLVKLLLRFYDVTSGEILLDGKNIKALTKESLRKAVGIVPQDTMMFNDTIRFNIGYAKENASLKEIKQAARLANLDTFIDSLSQKYDTLVGERGIKLSGGQRQRLAIARTILEDPPIVVFDEATSQLDSESEKAIQDAFWKIAKNKTTIIVAHRLSTIRKADRIIVLKEGRIVEEGTHSELSAKKGGVYNGLWNLQTGELKD